MPAFDGLSFNIDTGLHLEALPAAWTSSDPLMAVRLKKLVALIKAELDKGSRLSLATERQLEQAVNLVRSLLAVRGEYFGLHAAKFAADQMLVGLKHEKEQLVKRHADEDSSTGSGSLGGLLERAVTEARANIEQQQAVRAAVADRFAAYEQGGAQWTDLQAERAEMDKSGSDEFKKKGDAWPETRRLSPDVKDSIKHLSGANAKVLAARDLDQTKRFANEGVLYSESAAGQARLALTANERVARAFAVSRAQEQRRIEHLGRVIDQYSAHVDSQGQAFDIRMAGLVERQLQLLAELKPVYRSLRLSAQVAFKYGALLELDFSHVSEGLLTATHRELTSLAAFLDERASRTFEFDLRIDLDLQGGTQALHPDQLMPEPLRANALLRAAAIEADAPGELVSLYFPDYFVRDIAIEPGPLVAPLTSPQQNAKPLLLTARRDPPRRSEDFAGTQLLWNNPGRGVFKLAGRSGLKGALWLRWSALVDGSVQAS